MHTVRLGIVGLGIMGRRYYTMLRALAGVEVTPLCVRHLNTIDDLPGAKFADYRRLCASGQIDAVIIATPHYSHPSVYRLLDVCMSVAFVGRRGAPTTSVYRFSAEVSGLLLPQGTAIVWRLMPQVICALPLCVRAVKEAR